MTIKLTHETTPKPKIGDKVRIKLKKDDGVYKEFNDRVGSITEIIKPPKNDHNHIYYTTITHAFGFIKSEFTIIK